MKLYYKEVANTVLDVKEDKRRDCFNWGKDNAFPSLIEALVDMSVTAKTCTKRVSKAIYGAGFEQYGKKVVNSKGQTLNEVLRLSAKWYSRQNNVFLHISYDANLDIRAINVIPVTDVRVGKADDLGYSGKFIVYDNWDKSNKKKIEKTAYKYYDKFNPNKEVVEKQVRLSSVDRKGKASSDNIEDIISNYNGQVLHIKGEDSFIYAMSDLSPVLSEMLLENNSQTFRSRGADKGFLNTKILTVAPFSDDDVREAFKKDLNELRGAEGSNDVLLLETSQMADDVSKQINLDDLSGAYNDKLFEYSDKQAEKNICKATLVPLMLVSQTDNSLFGSSGEMLKEAKLQLWESREEERSMFEDVFSRLMMLFQESKRIKPGLLIKNPYKVMTEQN